MIPPAIEVWRISAPWHPLPWRFAINADGRPLALLATMDGGRAEERAIHERFAEHRLGRTEQFRPTAEILAFIGRPLFAAAGEVREMPGRYALLPVYEGTARFLKQVAGEYGLSVPEFCDRFLLPCVERAHKEYIRAESKKIEGSK